MISICIIAKNEQQNIEKCLKAISSHEVEIILVDTGSTDKTKEIASKYTDCIYDFEWCDDFAAAKNFAILKASNDVVMIIDSDEYIVELDEFEVEKNALIHKSEVGRIKRKNQMNRNGIEQENVEWINRVFLKSEFEYRGCIHEQVISKSRSDYNTYKTCVVIDHSGYDMPEELRKEKANRNITLLEKELDRLCQECGCTDIMSFEGVKPKKNTPQEQIPYILYQLGKSYYMSKEYAVAVEYFSMGLIFDLDTKLEYVIDMVETYGYALVNSGQSEAALFFESLFDEFGNSADFRFLMGIIYMNNARFDDAIEEFLKATEFKECKMSGVNSYSAFYNIGVIYECLEKTEKAVKYYKMCGEYAPALDRINKI